MTLVNLALIICLVATNNRTGLLMPNERLTMRKIHEILRLHWDCNLSHRQIASSCSVARSTVAEYIRRANSAGLSLARLTELDEEKLEELLFPEQTGRPSGATRPLPNFSEWHDELKAKGMTISLLWEGYKQDNSDGYNYSFICEQYRLWQRKLDVVMKQHHVAGEKLFSDFAGSKLAVTDPRTGEVTPVSLFVAALGASSYTYAEGFLDESSESWCEGHANSFSFFGGCTELVIPDNAKSAVTSPSIYEPDLNPDFQHMAEFFGVGVIPARVRKPRDKAVVEAAVRVATMWIVSVLRKQTFFSLAELNREIRKLLDKLNNRAFKKAPGSRRILFESIEQKALKPLPINKYEYTHIGYARAGRDYHVNLDGYLYSVPYEFCNEKVEYRITSKSVEIFLKGRRIASHARLWIKDKPSTVKEHMPVHHQYYQEQYIEWTPEKLISSASNIGNGAVQAVETIMKKSQHSEQKFRACLGILRLARTWGKERLDAACSRAIALNACSFKHIKLILENGGDRRPPQTPSLQIARTHENVRGAEYYSQSNEDNTNANTSNNRESALPETDGNDPGSGISAANA